MNKLLIVLALSVLPTVSFAKISPSKELLEGLNKLYCSAYFSDKADELVERRFKEEYAKAEVIARQTGRAFTLPDYRLNPTELIERMAYLVISERLGQQAVNDLRVNISQLPMDELLSDNELLAGQSREFLAGYHVALVQLETKKQYEGWQPPYGSVELFKEEVERRGCNSYLSKFVK